MKRLNRGCTAFVLVSIMAATAYADDPPAPPAPAPAPAPTPEPAAPRKFVGVKTTYYVSGGVADSTFWTIGTTFAPGVSIAVGLNINYDRNGLAIPGMTTRSTDKLSFQGIINGTYYFYNVFPYGIAAELALITPLAPSAFDPSYTIRPGVVFYYAPFHAPLVFGTALDLAITVPKGPAKVSVQTVTPGVRLVYVF